MAFNIYGEPIPDIVTEKPAVELPQRADGRACNIYGEPIEGAETVAAKIQQLPPTPMHVQLVQGAVNATFSTLGSVAAFLAEGEHRQWDDDHENKTDYPSDYIDHDGELNGSAEPDYYL